MIKNIGKNSVLAMIPMAARVKTPQNPVGSDGATSGAQGLAREGR